MKIGYLLRSFAGVFAHIGLDIRVNYTKINFRFLNNFY